MQTRSKTKLNPKKSQAPSTKQRATDPKSRKIHKLINNLFKSIKVNRELKNGNAVLQKNCDDYENFIQINLQTIEQLQG